MKLIIRKSNDADLVAEIETKLKQNGGYCPCRISKSADTKCVCKSFREQRTPGECHCGLYEKIEAET